MRGPKTIRSLVDICHMRHLSWEEFQKELRSLVKPESTTSSNYFGTLLTKLQEPHNALVEADLFQKYLEYVFKAAKLKLQAKVSMTPEYGEEYWKQVQLFFDFFMECFVLDAQMSLHRDQLVNWSETTPPNQASTLEFARWVETTQYPKQQIILQGSKEVAAHPKQQQPLQQTSAPTTQQPQQLQN